MKRVRTVIATVMCLSLLVGAAGCGDDNGSANTFTFASSVAPISLDPAFTDTTDAFRVEAQMYETLITHRPGTAQLAPGLAEDWDIGNGGKTLTFYLQRNVTFHDGTRFNAAAVCYNFDRWLHTASVEAQNSMTYYGDVFEGFAKNSADGLGDPIYQSCTAKDDYTAEIHLDRYKGALPAALTLPSFSISSPTALRKYHADHISVTGGRNSTVKFSDYAYRHPTGTGPFKFKKWDRKTGTITMVRNDNYWGRKARMKNLVFRTIPDQATRKKELLAGKIDGYDFPAFSDYADLKKKKFNLHVRPAFNLLYLGINQSHNENLPIREFVRQSHIRLIEKSYSKTYSPRAPPKRRNLSQKSPRATQKT